jgi:endonuclease/exonuclease/phosphatase family metal-dependent hydrolase
MEQLKIRLFRKISAVTTLLLLTFFYSLAGAEGWDDGHDHHKRTVTVMTQNMDAGTDLGYLFKVPDLLTAASLTYGEILESDIPGHAAVLARIIARQQPDLISLQEVTLWQTASADQKTSVLYDQLELLLKALKKLNKPYKVVIGQTLSQSQLPVDPNLIGRPSDMTTALSFTDRDVIIARADLKHSELALSHRQKHIYSTLLRLPLGTSTRGWLSVDARIRGKSIRFVNTHLETVIPFIPQTPLIQAAQAEELIKAMHNTQLPVVLAGDFNADAEFAGIGPDQTDTPNIIRGAGFIDTWEDLHPNNRGFTWPLFREDPLEPNPNGPFERIDLIFARDLDVLDVHRVGNLSRHFASDHAGVVAKLLINEHNNW